MSSLRPGTVRKFTLQSQHLAQCHADGLLCPALCASSGFSRGPWSRADPGDAGRGGTLRGHNYEHKHRQDMQSKQDRDLNPIMFRESRLMEVKWPTQGQLVLSDTTKNPGLAVIVMVMVVCFKC